MPRALLIGCPVCDSVRALEGKRSGYSKSTLCATAREHLCDHNLTESKTAIRKHQLIAESVELLVTATEFDQLPIEEWQPHTATELPNKVFAGGDTSAATNASPDKVSASLSFGRE